VAYFRAVVEQVERVPGVVSAAVIDYIDFQAEDDFAGILVPARDSRPDAYAREEWRRVSERLFETAGMPIVQGRPLQSGDFTGIPRAAVVNEALAAKHFGGRDAAVGEYLSTSDERYRDLEIVGVVGDVRSLGPASPSPPMLYVPNQGSPRGTQGLYVRVGGERPLDYAGAVRDAVGRVDPSQPITDIAPMSERVGSWVAIPRATRSLVTALAALALALSAIGIFGVVAYAVRVRRSELGVRLALGASPARLERAAITAVLPVLAAGVGVGLLTGTAAARSAGTALVGVSPLDPTSLFAGVVAVGAAVLLATWLPARRIARIDPTEAMRAD
jgi:hypothetical protein